MAKKRRRRSKSRKFKFKLKINPKLIWITIFSLFAIVLVSGLIYAVYTLDIFKVKKEDLKSNITLSSDLEQKIIGQSLFNLDIEYISSRILKENPGYKKVYVIKKFPSSLIIDSKKRGFFAQIKAKRFYPLDREATVLSEGKLVPYEYLIPIEINTYNSFFKKGDVINDRRLVCAFDLIEALGQAGFLVNFSLTSINSTNLDATYFFIDGKAPTKDQEAPRNIKIIIGDRDFKQRLNFLKDIIKQELQDKMSLVDYIDLRHKKVYVGFRR